MTSPPQGHFNYVNSHTIDIGGRPYGFCTLVSMDGVVAWMPDTEQQHVNPQYRGGENPHPVWVDGVNKWDSGRIIQQILLFQTKQHVPLETIIEEHKPLIGRILADFHHFISNTKIDKSN